MENLQPPLATESFSYRWLFNGSPSLDSPIDEAITTFIVHPKRFLNEEAQNFNFDLPAASSESALSMVHADEIFSDGQIMPLYINRSKTESITAPVSLLTSTAFISGVEKDGDHFIDKWRGLPSRILHKWLSYLKPLFNRLEISRNTFKVDDLKRKEREVMNSVQASAPRFTKAYSAVDRERIGKKMKNLRKSRSWSNTPQVSPLQSPYHSTGDRDDMECLVAEAILHCKRSFGMLDSSSS